MGPEFPVLAFVLDPPCNVYSPSVWMFDPDLETDFELTVGKSDGVVAELTGMLSLLEELVVTVAVELPFFAACSASKALTF